jgi:hypothetical protein
MRLGHLLLRWTQFTQIAFDVVLLKQRNASRSAASSIGASDNAVNKARTWRHGN